MSENGNTTWTEGVAPDRWPEFCLQVDAALDRHVGGGVFRAVQFYVQNSACERVEVATGKFVSLGHPQLEVLLEGFTPNASQWTVLIDDVTDENGRVLSQEALAEDIGRRVAQLVGGHRSRDELRRMSTEDPPISDIIFIRAGGTRETSGVTERPSRSFRARGHERDLSD